MINSESHMLLSTVMNILGPSFVGVGGAGFVDVCFVLVYCRVP